VVRSFLSIKRPN